MDRRFKPKNEKRNYSITKLRDRHKEIIRLLSLGMENKEISEMLGVTPQNISDVRNSPLAQKELSIMQAQRDAESLDIAIQIKNTAPAAFKILETMINRENEYLAENKDERPSVLAISTAKDVLDRAGHSAVKKQFNMNASSKLTPEDIERMKQDAFKAKNVVHADYQEVK